jgi:hypothetical protein
MICKRSLISISIKLNYLKFKTLLMKNSTSSLFWIKFWICKKTVIFKPKKQTSIYPITNSLIFQKLSLCWKSALLLKEIKLSFTRDWLLFPSEKIIMNYPDSIWSKQFKLTQMIINFMET